MKYLWIFGTLLAGSLLPMQNILNSRLGKQSGGALMGVFLSFVIGTVCLLILNAVTNSHALTELKPAKVSPWFLWLGGVLGAVFLGYTTWVTQHQSIALTFIFIVCGQIFMSLLIDNYGWMGATVRPVSRSQLAGILLIIAGIFLIRK